MPDYSVGNAPAGASYAAPLQGFAFGKAISDLPEQYMQGREQARKTQMEDMFKGGVPTNEDGTPDINAIIARGAQVGGLPFVQGMIPFLNDLAIGKEVVRGLEPLDRRSGAYPSPASAARNVPNAGGPANVTPNIGYSGSAPTINSVVANSFGSNGPQIDQSDIEKLASRLNIDPNRPLNPRQVQQVKNALGSSGSANQEMQPPLKGTSAYDAGVNAKPLPASGVSGAAGPSQGSFAERFAGGDPQRGLAPGISVEEAQRLEDVGNRKMRASVAAGRMSRPGMGNELKAAAEADFARAKVMREQLGEAYKLTGSEKEALNPAVQAVKGQDIAQKQELTRGDALQRGIQGSAREFETALKPHLDAMRGIMNNPNFVSGTGEGFLTALNKIRSNPFFQHLPGYDPNAALPNEAIRKVVSASILNQTTQLKDEAAEIGGTAGRLFQQQISLMEKAAQNPDATLPALRYLTELQQRMGDHSRAVAKLANDYNGKYGKGVLDNGFNDILAKYNSDPKNQIFKPDEIKDMRLFAPPTAPRLDSEAQAKTWARQAGLKPGDPMKLPSGRIVPAP